MQMPSKKHEQYLDPLGWPPAKSFGSYHARGNLRHNTAADVFLDRLAELGSFWWTCHCRSNKILYLHLFTFVLRKSINLLRNVLVMEIKIFDLLCIYSWIDQDAFSQVARSYFSWEKKNVLLIGRIWFLAVSVPFRRAKECIVQIKVCDAWENKLIVAYVLEYLFVCFE